MGKTDQEVMSALRHFRELSYREVGTKMRMSHSRIQQLENSSGQLSAEFIAAFLDALKLEERDWIILKTENEDVSEMKLECLARIHHLTAEQVINCLIYIRNLVLVLALI